MIITDFEQGTEEWLQSKVGVVGGTRLKKIITPVKLQLSKSADDLILRLIDENITGISSEKQFSSEASDRGNDLEPEARRAYIKKTGIDISEFGLCLSDDNNLHGCSPDGFTPDLKGAIEIKCLGHVHLKHIKQDNIPDEYKMQVINYFLVNDKLEWLDFVLYRPEFIHEPLHIKRVTREGMSEEIELCQRAVEQFFINYRNKLNEYIF